MICTPSFARRAATFGVALLQLLPCAAQDGSPPREPAGQASAEPSEGTAESESTQQRLSLTIDQALALALQNDIGLSIEELASDVAHLTARGSWGAFDWLFATEWVHRCLFG